MQKYQIFSIDHSFNQCLEFNLFNRVPYTKMVGLLLAVKNNSLHLTLNLLRIGQFLVNQKIFKISL